MKEEITRLPKEVVPEGAGLTGNERDGIASSDGGLSFGKRRTALLRKRARGEARNEGWAFWSSFQQQIFFISIIIAIRDLTGNHSLK